MGEEILFENSIYLIGLLGGLSRVVRVRLIKCVVLSFINVSSFFFDL